MSGQKRKGKGAERGHAVRPGWGGLAPLHPRRLQQRSCKPCGKVGGAEGPRAGGWPLSTSPGPAGEATAQLGPALPQAGCDRTPGTRHNIGLNHKWLPGQLLGLWGDVHVSAPTHGLHEASKS